MMTEVEKWLVTQPETAALLASRTPIWPSARLVYGMSACGGGELEGHYRKLHDALEQGRIQWYGWGNPWYDADASEDDGIRKIFGLNPYSTDPNDTGEYWVEYFTFNPHRATYFDSRLQDRIADPTLTYEDVVREFVGDQLGLGRSCGHTHDCCGCRFTSWVHIWPSGDDRWYGKVAFARNI